MSVELSSTPRSRQWKPLAWKKVSDLNFEDLEQSDDGQSIPSLLEQLLIDHNSLLV